MPTGARAPERSRPSQVTEQGPDTVRSARERTRAPAAEGVAAMLRKEVPLPLGLHTLGEDCETHALPQGHDSADNGGIAGDGKHIPDEGLVDLHLVQGQVF